MIKYDLQYMILKISSQQFDLIFYNISNKYYEIIMSFL